MSTAVVLLSGGMDSTVAAFYAATKYDKLVILSYHYDQKAVMQELYAAHAISLELQARWPNLAISHYIHELRGIFDYTKSSIVTATVPVVQYESVEQAVEETASDPSYIPLRNAVFLSLAASALLTHDPNGGAIVTGIRSRPDGTGGFPDCTRFFSGRMSHALSEGSARNIEVVDILNQVAPSRADTIKLAQILPGCFEALRHTFSCFEGVVDNHDRPCGKCLPCLRRAQAFATVGVADPALEKQS